MSGTARSFASIDHQRGFAWRPTTRFWVETRHYVGPMGQFTITIPMLGEGDFVQWASFGYVQLIRQAQIGSFDRWTLRSFRQQILRSQSLFDGIGQRGHLGNEAPTHVASARGCKQRKVESDNCIEHVLARTCSRSYKPRTPTRQSGQRSIGAETQTTHHATHIMTIQSLQ